MKTPKTIAIIGGTGKMCPPFKEAFEKQGYEVIISGRKTEISHIEAAKMADVVIVTVPIRNTVETIKKVGPYIKEGALFTDFTSVKTLPVNAMLESSKAEVIGGHPVFGPTVDLKGQMYVLCPARGGNYVEWYREFLEKCGINVIITTPEEHDKKMAVVQCLTHLSHITMADTLKNMGIDIKKTLEVSSPVYKIKLDMIGRILNQDPALYSDIQIYNPFSEEVMAGYSKSLQKLSEKIKNEDCEGFEKIFSESAKFLGNFCNDAQKESDYLIKKLAERK